MWNPFRRKEQRSSPMAINELLSYLGVSNTGAGEFVSPNTAESLPAVMSAVTVISEAVASMPCYLYQLKDDGRERVYRHPVDYLLNEMPNRSQTPYQFKYTMMRHCLLNGNAYAVIEWNSKGEPISLTPYEPSAVNIYRKVGGEYIYQITFMGRSPITICRETVGLGIAQQKHGSAVMKNGLMASGLITTAEWLDDAKAQKAVKALERYKGAKNAGKTPILEGSMEYKQLGMTNQDAEWLASRTFTISDIARIYNISPIFLQDYSNSSYSNFSEASRAFLSQTLRPWLTNFEQQLKDALMIDLGSNSKKRYLIEFDTSDLLRTSQSERFKSYDVAIKAGVMCPNEVRRREGLPPYEGGEEFSQAWKQTVEVKRGDEQEPGASDGNHD